MPDAGSSVECLRNINFFFFFCYFSGFAFKIVDTVCLSLRKRDLWYNDLWNE